MGATPGETAPAKSPGKGKGRHPPWAPGQSGNPPGKPVGARHKTTLAIEALVALTGDVTALKVCLDRLLPIRRDRHIAFRLPPLERPDDARVAISCIAEGIATGALTPLEAEALAKVVAAFSKSTEIVDFEARLARLEGRSVTIIPP